MTNENNPTFAVSGQVKLHPGILRLALDMEEKLRSWHLKVAGRPASGGYGDFPFNDLLDQALQHLQKVMNALWQNPPDHLQLIGACAETGLFLMLLAEKARKISGRTAAKENHS